MALLDPATLMAYLAACVLLVLMPGPGMAWVTAQTVAGGFGRGVRAGLGLETATLIHALVAGLGLSAVLATSALAFELLKYAGAAYLIWLGIKSWRSGDAAAPGSATPLSPRAIYLRSVMTGVLNPKVALFFLAFLPQFVQPERGWVWLQFLLLGALLSLVGFCNNLLLSYAVGRLGRRVRTGTGRWNQRVTGAVLIGLGLRLAVEQRA